MSKGLFIVLEGLDGSGKSTAAKQLAHFLESALDKKVKMSYEPHNPSCGGEWIRDVLEKRITTFSYETLVFAFAANRLDHGDRVIKEWLSKSEDHILICDRYYLSSLVYQTSDQVSKEEVMQANRFALQPDLTLFMNVSNEVCYERMQVRNQPEELFEKDLSETREKYFNAIQFLEESHNEKIKLINANGTVKEVVANLVDAISELLPESNSSINKAMDQFELVD